jgi:Tfp pilus assembly pilus retraction ATPase PilT
LADSLVAVINQRMLKKKDKNDIVIAQEIMINNVAIANNIRKNDIKNINNTILISKKD